MGSEAPAADKLMNEENTFKNTSSISKVDDDVEVKNIALLSQSSDVKDNHQEPSIGPLTPDSNRENGEQSHDLLSPLKVVLPSRICSNSSDGNVLETPKEALFDSFAPGPDKFMLAPRRMKYGKELSNHVVRCLNFSCATNLMKDFSHETSMDTSDDEACATNLVKDYGHETSIETSDDEERLFESFHSAILDNIFSEQTGSRDSDDSDFERQRTPKSARILSWVAETCPGAPMKSTRKFRDVKIEQELCRKLEF